MQVKFSAEPNDKADAIIVGVCENNVLTEEAKEIDQQTGGLVEKTIKVSRFEGRFKETKILTAPSNISANHIILLGFGDVKKLNCYQAECLGGSLAQTLKTTKDKSIDCRFKGINAGDLSETSLLSHMALGLKLKSWKFNKYRTKKKAEGVSPIEDVSFLCSDPQATNDGYSPLKHRAEGILFARELVTEPCNLLTPTSFANRLKELKTLGIDVDILGEKEMQDLGMGALLGVGQGSTQESKLVVMHWQGAQDSSEQPLSFIGKGVTFDTGGISLKPSLNMDEMKADMGGAAVVSGLMHSLAARKAKVNAVGVVGLVENMPSGNAQRPGDVVTSMSGQTIEVLNTDAEGRLVLADALWYTQERFKPKIMIDLATLTGAIVVALGHEYAGLFSNDDDLRDNILRAAKNSGDKTWPLPLNEAFDRQMDSTIADIKNIGGGRAAGSITAAQFLQRFIRDVPWAHLDIAGVSWMPKSTPLFDKGASGFGVALLDELVNNNYESIS